LSYHQSIIIWTLKTKSLLPSLYKRSRLSRDLAKRGDLPARSRFGEGRGEIFRGLCLFYYGILGNCFYFLIRPSSFMITSYSTIFFFTRAREASGPMNSVLKPF
jgi:hypothetical protein